MIPARTKRVTLIFHRSELLYDIKNYAYIEGDVKKTDDEHDRHQVIDIGEDGNIDRVTRMLDLAMAQCTEACYPYSKEPVEDETLMTDRLVETSDYVLELLVSDDFSQTTVTLLERYIHEFLVCRVLADWMSITNPDSAANWLAKAAEAEEGVRHNLNGRVGRVRKTQTPF